MPFDDLQRKPYLTTKEVIALTGVTRRVLDGYIRSGICHPVRESNAAHAEKHWSIEQVSLIENARTLQYGGMSLDEITRLINEGALAVNDALYVQSMKDTRNARRKLKSTTTYRKRLKTAIAVGKRENLYLRHIPQRWMALLPTTKQSLVEKSPYTHDLANLDKVTQVAGWCRMQTKAVLASISENGNDLSYYTALQLASPPMPYATGNMVIDGGCYHAIDPQAEKSNCPECDRCFDCARFGRNPTKEERLLWEHVERENPHLWDKTVMLADLDEPYPTGTWSDHTERYFGSGAEDTPPGRTFRPRLMPHESRLPLGTTACVFPAGVYLCAQCDGKDRGDAFQRLFGMSAAMHHKPFTRDEEKALCEQSSVSPSQRKKPHDRGASLEPFAGPREESDPQHVGLLHDIAVTDLQKIVIPTRTALQPEDGFCIVVEEFPAADYHTPERYELHLLVANVTQFSEETPPR